MDPFFRTGLSISDSLKTVRKSVLIYETIILRQDCRDAQKKYVMHCMTLISQQECRGILEFLKVIVTIKIISCPVYSCKLFQY